MTKEYDHISCGLTKTLKTIGSRWTLHILRELCDGKPKRFGELERALTGISPRTLSLRLKQLEKDALVSKRVFAEIPLHVEYTLTRRGSSIKSIITQLQNWGETA